ncbi:Uncharacterized protein SCF082_LOCUS33582 [Durusdinium trenchii]|uniref:Uncharacterized protein n=1 Tax=Durusdinium trenchii TaxID=1381693 RepID=A0ABP0NQB4_9DINO
MRLRRLCEKKQKSGKCHVDASTADQYHRGGEEREWLEIALIEAICKVGTVSKSHKKLRAEFRARVVMVRERMDSKEQEVLGQWFTEERMEKSGDFSKHLGLRLDPCSTVACDAEQEVATPFGAMAALKETTEEGVAPQPEQLGTKVLPDLVRFMDNSDSKIMAAHNINGKLQVETGVAGNPAVQELMKDIEQVSTQLNQVFKASAEVKAECSLDTAVEASEELILWHRHGVLSSIMQFYIWRGPRCAALIAIESRHKLQSACQVPPPAQKILLGAMHVAPCTDILERAKSIIDYDQREEKQFLGGGMVEDYRDDSTVMDELITVVVQSLDKATSAHLLRSYRNVPKAASSARDCTGICHICAAGQPNYDYEDVTRGVTHGPVRVARPSPAGIGVQSADPLDASVVRSSLVLGPPFVVTGHLRPDRALVVNLASLWLHDFSFLFLALVGFLLSCKPDLVTPKSLDAWYVTWAEVVTSLIWNVTLLPATHFDVRDVISFSIAVRIVFAVLTKRVMAFGRRWAKPSREDDGKMANMNFARMASLQQSSSMFSVGYGFAFTFAGVAAARRLLEENATLKLDLQGRQVELGAVKSLLTVCYDAVVEVDETLQLTDDSRQLSTMLLHSAPIDGKGLAGRCLLDLFPEEDQVRISQQFQSSVASDTTSVMALCADMLDSDQNHVKVELFHAQFRTLTHKRCFLVGVREIQVAEPHLGGSAAVSPTLSSSPHASDLTVTFEVPSFDILLLSEEMERFCSLHLGRLPENILEISSESTRPLFCDVLQVLVKSYLQRPPDERLKGESFTFSLIGSGDVAASFYAKHDMLLNTMVGVLRIQELTLQSLTEVANGLASPAVSLRRLSSQSESRESRRRERTSRAKQSEESGPKPSESGMIRTLHHMAL